MTLGILYHMPFWQTADGALWEAEGSFARYVDSIAPYFDRVILSVPVFDTPPGLLRADGASASQAGSRLKATNVSLAPLPYFPGPRQFYPKLFAIRPLLRRWVDQCDVIHLRVPSPAAIFAFRIAAARRKPVFLLVVGDYEALLPHLGYAGIKKWLFARYVDFEERALRYMTKRALTFANGAALRAKHERDGATVHETKTTTLTLADVATRTDTCTGARIKLVCVSRIDPRKGLRSLPSVVSELVAAGHDVTLDVVGPTIGLIGESERDAIVAEAARSGVADRVALRGPVALDHLMPLYREFDLFVLPTRPGEGIPRVLLEAMAAGLPIVTTEVSGISSLITHGENGLLVPDGSSTAVAGALKTLIADPALRQRLIKNGYATARTHTLEQQANGLMQIVARECGVSIRQPDAA